MQAIAPFTRPPSDNMVVMIRGRPAMALAHIEQWRDGIAPRPRHPINRKVRVVENPSDASNATSACPGRASIPPRNLPDLHPRGQVPGWR